MSKKFDISMIEGEQKLFSLKSNAFKTAMLEIVVDIMIDADMDGDSSIYISCKRDGGEIFGTWLEYHNGCGMEDNFEGTIVLISESHYDIDGLNEFKDELKEYVEKNLNPLIEKKELLQYTAIRYGGPEPVADIPCVECGEYGVSILDDFYPVGYCCYCGEENYIKQCNKCGKWYEDNGENDTICTECLEEILRK